MAKLLSPMTVWGLVRELKTAAQETRPLAVSGPLAEQLAKELSRGAAPGAVRVEASVGDDHAHAHYNAVRRRLESYLRSAALERHASPAGR